MNNGTAQTLVDDLVKDISDILGADPSKTAIIWWRGRLSGVVETIEAVNDQVDLTRVHAALSALYEAEESL